MMTGSTSLIAEIAVLKARRARLEAALHRITTLRVDSPSSLGALHGVGMSHGFDIARQIAEQALISS